MRLKIVASIVAALALAPAPTWAQGELNGAVAGTVRDTTGSVLPGVTVEAASPALIEKVRTAVTNEQGQYRIIDLRPGTYTVTFSLTGFSRFERRDVELTTGFTATINAELGLAAVQETITVSGAPPTVDVQNVRAQTVVTREVLDALPTAKDLAGYAISTPGADGGATSRSVGGNKGEGFYAMTLHGAGAGHTTQDGMMVESPVGAGTGRGYFSSQALVQEVVLYAQASAETEAGGLNVNVVTRDGGNIFSGSANLAYAGENMQQGNLSDDLRARGLLDSNRLNEVYDVGGGMGGPLKRDTVWFYGAARRWGAEERVAGLYFNKLPSDSLFYEPDLDRPAVAPNNYYDTSGKITVRVGRHKIAGALSQQYKCNCYIFLGASGLNAAAVRTPEATSHSKAPWPGSYVRQLTWNFAMSNRLLLEAGIGQRRQDTFYDRPDESSPTARSVADLGLGLEYGAKLNGPNWLLEQGRGIQVRRIARVAVSYVSGSHQFKAGYNKAWGSITVNAQPNYPVQYVFQNRTPISLNQVAAPHTEDNRLKAQDALFAQDQWTIRRLTLNMGLRLDYHNAYNPAQTLPATEFTDSFHFDPKYDLPNWKDISPRFGAAYDLFGNARSALKVSINRYVVPDSLSLSQAVNPANAIATTTSRTWGDADGDYVPDCDLRDPGRNGECGAMANQAFGTQIATTQYLDDVLHGWGVRPNNWQISTALEQQLLANVGVTVAYFRTWQQNFRVTDNLAVTSSDYDQFCVTVPTDSRLPGGGGNQLCGLYDVADARFGQINNVVTRASHFGEQTQTYNGVDLTMNARFGGGGLLTGGVSFGRTDTNDCAVRPDSPERLYCDRTPPWTNETFFKLAGSYPLPWGLAASATFQNLPGIPVQANVVYSNNDIAPSLGRNLAACPTPTGPCTSTRTISVTEPGQLSEPRLNQLDLRLAKTFRFDRWRVKPVLDLYNALNASPVLRVNNTFSALWPRPTDVLGGRTVKIGADIDF